MLTKWHNLPSRGYPRIFTSRSDFGMLRVTSHTLKPQLEVPDSTIRKRVNKCGLWGRVLSIKNRGAQFKVPQVEMEATMLQA